jgi:hypothetical protein
VAATNAMASNIKKYSSCVIVRYSYPFTQKISSDFVVSHGLGLAALTCTAITIA